MGQPFFKRRRGNWKFPEYCWGNKADWKTLSDECKQRDGFKCTQCGAGGWQVGGNTMLQACHIVSKSKGGPDTLSNLVTKCVSCHSKEPGHEHMRSSMARWTV